MLEKITHAIIPNLIGLTLIIIGWYISLLNVGLNRFTAGVLFTKWTFLGLVLIIIGAYIPRFWGRVSILPEDKK